MFVRFRELDQDLLNSRIVSRILFVDHKRTRFGSSDKEKNQDGRDLEDIGPVGAINLLQCLYELLFFRGADFH